MEMKGKFSLKMINKSEHKDKYFDSDYNFLWNYIDRVTKQRKVQKIQGNVLP